MLQPLPAPDQTVSAKLAALTNPDLVAQTVATALALEQRPGTPLVDLIVEHLASEPRLLVLDNAEHLADACARLADALLRRCPKLVLVVTSRQPLQVRGELTFHVPPLSTPRPDRDITAERVCRSESARLFVERASDLPWRTRS